MIALFNVEGLALVKSRQGGGRRSTYDAAARERISREARRMPPLKAGGFPVVLVDTFSQKKHLLNGWQNLWFVLFRKN
ncbi:hypothetical protein [Paludisphaera rhizosphaerae]|uniref:hypothetical protein n=1 Tax=Paludisphaera rhizosphaerae TaxID=2711216 RepID=UPI0019826656|nr:hypothetical protein [Paludisphaera rhizosphaerae]